MPAIKLTQEIVNYIRKVHREDDPLYREISDMVFEEFDVRISVVLVSRVVNKQIWVTKAKIAKRSDNYPNDYYAKLAAAKDDKLEVPYTNEERIEELKDVGYDLDF